MTWEEDSTLGKAAQDKIKSVTEKGRGYLLTNLMYQPSQTFPSNSAL